MKPAMTITWAVAALTVGLGVLSSCAERSASTGQALATAQPGIDDGLAGSLVAAPIGGDRTEVTATAVPYPYPQPSTVAFPPSRAYPAGTPTQEVWTPPPPPTLMPSQTPLPPTVTPLSTVDVAQLSAEAVRAMGVWRAIESDYAFPVRQVSDTPLGVDGVAWSPDGRRLVVDMALGQVDQMMSWAETTPLVLAPDGGGWVVGSRGNNPCGTYNAWSPDGAQLAYIARGEVWLANADGSGKRILPSPPGTGPSTLQFAPQGERLAVLVGRREDNRYVHELWLYDTESGPQTLLIGDIVWGEFSWSPAGDALALVGDGVGALDVAQLWIAELTASGVARVVSAELDEIAGTDAGCLSRPVWALGGEKVVANVLLQHRVWVMDRDGEVQLLSVKGEGYTPYCTRFSLSYEGRYVAYTGLERDRVPVGLIYDLEERIVTETVSTADVGLWSPAAPKLFFNAFDRGLMLLDVVAQRTVAVGGGTIRGIDLPIRGAWSPDGSRFAYWRQEADSYGLWLWTPEEAPVLLLESVEPAWGQRNPFYLYERTPQWRPDGRALAVVAIRDEQPEAYLIEMP